MCGQDDCCESCALSRQPALSFRKCSVNIRGLRKTLPLLSPPTFRPAPHRSGKSFSTAVCDCMDNLELRALMSSPPSALAQMTLEVTMDFSGGGQLSGKSPVLEALLGKPKEMPWTCWWITGWLKGFQIPTMTFSF